MSSEIYFRGSKEVNYEIRYKIGNTEDEEIKCKVISAPGVYDAKELFHAITPEFDREKSRIISIVSYIPPLEDDFEFPDPPKAEKKDHLYFQLLEENGWKWWMGNTHEKLFKNTHLRITVTYNSVRIYETFFPGVSKDNTLFFGRNVKTIEDLNVILNKIGVEEL